MVPAFLPIPFPPIPPKPLHPAGASWVYCLPTDGSLYAVGGYDSSSHLATVEKYEPQVHNAPLSQFLPLKCRVEWGTIPSLATCAIQGVCFLPLTLRYPAKIRAVLWQGWDALGESASSLSPCLYR